MSTRRTQADRSETTRAALTDAALDLLIENGWAATTTVAVVERAGVTRGALVHHYEGLSDLLAAALGQLYGRYAAETMTPTTLAESVELMWSVAGDRRFKAAIEAWMAAGNDPQLATALGPVIADFAKLVHPDQRLVLGASATEDHRETANAFVLTARETLLGLALGRAVTGGRPLSHEPVVLDHLRSEAARLDATITPT